MLSDNFWLSAVVSLKVIVYPRKRYIKITGITFFIILCQAGFCLGVALLNDLNC